VSKHIIILNEEILVLVSFLAFLAFCSHSASATAEEAMQARTVTTLQELQQNLRVQLDATRELHAYHTLCLESRNAMKTLATLATSELQAKETSRAGEMVKTLCVEQTRARADVLSLQHASFQSTLQNALRASFRACAPR
jgi:hypothetical protein